MSGEFPSPIRPDMQITNGDVRGFYYNDGSGWKAILTGALTIEQRWNLVHMLMTNIREEVCPHSRVEAEEER